MHSSNTNVVHIILYYSMLDYERPAVDPGARAQKDGAGRALIHFINIYVYIYIYIHT